MAIQRFKKNTLSKVICSQFVGLVAFVALVCSQGIGFLLPSQFLNITKITALIPLVCPFHFITGLLCPTCGLGRSLIAAATGNFLVSWQFHPLGLFLYIVLFVVVGAWACDRIPFLVKQLTNIKTAYLKLPRNISYLSLLTYLVWGFARNF